MGINTNYLMIYLKELSKIIYLYLIFCPFNTNATMTSLQKKKKLTEYNLYSAFLPKPKTIM